MSNKGNAKISDWIKTNSSVKKVSDDLGKSRPTIYKMMKLYDEGRVDLLPQDILAYFEEKLAEGETEAVIKIKAKLTNEMLKLSEMISIHQNRIPQILNEKAILANEYALLSKKMGEETDEIAKEKIQYQIEKLQDQQDKFENNLACETMELEALKAKYEECRNNLAHYDSSVTSVILDNKDTFSIKTTCTIEGNKCMIIHNGKSNMLDYKFFLQIYGKVGDEFIMLKEIISDSTPVYENEWDDKPIGTISTNYFIIDDFLFSGPLYYKIVGFNDGVSDEKNTSGMCPLRQSR